MAEDNTCLYLIEEFVEGESLEAFMLHQSIIPITFVYEIGIQLCQVLSFLHGHKPYPIIYQDLKPEHVLLNKDKIKLIDFDTSSELTLEGNKNQNYGTPKFAAPEQILGVEIDKYTDIYALGKLLEELLHTGHGADQNLKHILKRALQKLPEQRYSSMEEMQLELITAKENMCQKQNPYHGKHLLQNIAIIGSEAHIGATHFAISLTVYLNQHGRKSIYIEKNAKKSVMNSGHEDTRFKQRGGLYRGKHFFGLPCYGLGVSIETDFKALQVRDYGSNMEDAMNDSADMYILVVGSRNWEMEDAEVAYEKIIGVENLFIICNYGDLKIAKFYSNCFEKSIYAFPLDENPFYITPKKAKLFRQLLKQKGGGKKEDDERNHRNHKQRLWKWCYPFRNCSFQLSSVRLFSDSGICKLKWFIRRGDKQ